MSLPSEEHKDKDGVSTSTVAGLGSCDYTRVELRGMVISLKIAVHSAIQR